MYLPSTLHPAAFTLSA